MKKHRYISIFLSLCFSVFLGHNLIPHHHHSEQVVVPVASECPVDHGDSHEHHHDADHKPLHCHAFNDVVFDKYNTLQIGELNALMLMSALPSVSSTLKAIHTEVFSRYILLKIPDKPSDYFGTHSLRGPPTIA